MRRWLRLETADRTIVVLAAQALGSLAVEPLYVLVDTAIVGRLGTEELGGLALAATVLSFVIAGCNFLTYGTTERVARRLGAGEVSAAAHVGVQSLWLAGFVSVVLMPTLWLAAPSLARILGGDGEVLDYATTYLRIGLLGVPFILLAMSAQGVLRGAADYRTPLTILFTANALNAVVEMFFVFGLDLGVPGSAWSTVIAQAVAAGWFAHTIRRRLAAAETKRPSRRHLAPLVIAGRHLLLRVMSMLGVLGGSTAVAARVDDPTLAAHQIGASLFTFLALVLDAFAVPAQTLIAEELGGGRRASAADLARRVARLSTVAATLVAVLLVATSPLVARIFTADGDVIDRAVPVLTWLAAVMFPGAVAFAHDGVLIGAGDYRFLGIAALGYLIAVLPIGVAVVASPSLGVHGIWAGIFVWMVLRAVVNNRRTAALLMS